MPFENDNFWGISGQLGKFGKDSKSSFTDVEIIYSQESILYLNLTVKQDHWTF